MTERAHATVESNRPALAVSASVVFSVRAGSAMRLSMKSYRASSGSCKMALRLMQFSPKTATRLSGLEHNVQV